MKSTAGRTDEPSRGRVSAAATAAPTGGGLPDADRAAPDPRSFFAPEVLALTAYHLDLSPCDHKLDQNEVPWELPRRAKELAARRLVDLPWSRYPDFHADELRRALGELHDWPWQGVLVGNGSNELLQLALAALVRSGGELLGVAPSFGLYPVFALHAGVRYRALPAGPNLRLPLAELAREVERDPRRAVLLCSPNNPTGEAVEPAWVDHLARRLTAPLLLDNAYGEFCRHDYRPLLQRHRHLLLFRTFSKAWSLAGLRLGYLLADPAVVAELIKLKLPYNVGQATVAAGLAALAAAPAADRRVRLLIGRRPQWASLLADFGAEVFPSEGNFVLARWPAATARRVCDGLAARGIRVRDVSGYPGLADCLRISVGSGRSLRAVEGALTAILGGRQ